MMNLYEMNAETRREVERMVDALVDNTLADEGTEWNALDEHEQDVYLFEACKTVAARLDMDYEDVWLASAKSKLLTQKILTDSGFCDIISTTK